jgi:hypothetical protein
MPAFVLVLSPPYELHTPLASFVFLDLDHNHLLGRHAIFQLHGELSANEIGAT